MFTVDIKLAKISVPSGCIGFSAWMCSLVRHLSTWAHSVCQLTCKLSKEKPELKMLTEPLREGPWRSCLSGWAQEERWVQRGEEGHRLSRE